MPRASALLALARLGESEAGWGAMLREEAGWAARLLRLTLGAEVEAEAELVRDGGRFSFRRRARRRSPRVTDDGGRFFAGRRGAGRDAHGADSAALAARGVGGPL